MLHGRDSSGRLHKLGTSVQVAGGERSPQWAPVEVLTAALGSCRQLRVEVWQLSASPAPISGAISSLSRGGDELLGVAELELPLDLVGVLSSGHTFAFPPRALTVPGQASAGPSAYPSSSPAGVNARGTLEGTFTLVEGGDKAEVQRLRAELAALKLKGGGTQLARLSLRLHASSLAAMDRNVLSKNSSDSYYVLQVSHPVAYLSPLLRYALLQLLLT